MGKTVSQLQKNIKIDEATNRITGDLLYVDGYTQFSSIPAEQEGTYLALGVTSSVDGTSIDVELSKKVKLDSDKQIVLKITEQTKRKPLRVTVTSDGKKETVSYDISGLKLSPKPED